MWHHLLSGVVGALSHVSSQRSAFAPIVQTRARRETRQLGETNSGVGVAGCGRAPATAADLYRAAGLGVHG
jgi:hypothetical protein